MRKPPGYWTEERVREARAVCVTLNDFNVTHKQAANAARRLGIFDEIAEGLIRNHRKITAGSALAVARGCTSRGQFQTEHRREYAWLARRGRVAEACQQWDKLTTAGSMISDADIFRRAAAYNHRGDFSLGDRTAYKYAIARDILGAVCAHMTPCTKTSDNNVVYIWREPKAQYNGKQVYKFGITSKRRGETRIREVNKDAEIVIMRNVVDAREAEKILHILGDDPQYTTGSGHTEFRALSDSELNEAITYIEGVAI